LLKESALPSAKKLIAIANRVPGNRRDRGSAIQFLENAASDALDSGTSRRLAGAGYVYKDHLNAT